MKTAFQVWEEASQAYPSLCDACAHKRTVRTDLDRPDFYNAFSCGLPEARAPECDAWRQYERRYQAAQERGARDLALVIENDDTDLQIFLQAILAGAPGAMEGLRDFLHTRVAEYAEMLS